MRAVFADTAYWKALLDPKDSWHPQSLDLSKALGATHIVTSELVLVEVLNMFSKWCHMRPVVSQFVEAILEDPTVTVVLTTPPLFKSALSLYKRSVDKQWSLVDCASLEIMKSKGITEALTSDHHFAQAGFIALFSKR